jgi:hypothetical protein
MPAVARAGSLPGEVDLPALFTGGRPFLTLTPPDGSRATAWLDTAGSGFITRAFATRAGLAVTNGRAALPKFAEPVPPVGGDGMLPVIDPDPGDKILAGVDIQLGVSWFAGRVWTIDYRNEQIMWHPDGHSITADAINPVPLHFPAPGYASLPVVVDGKLVEMFLDTAASVVGSTGTVYATSFITQAQFAAWHSAHVEWPVKHIAQGVDQIEVPGVHILTIGLGDVSFTTRLGDDVFSGEHLPGKLGSNAWAFHVLMLDYKRGMAAFE